MAFNIFVGSYTDVITTLSFDPTSNPPTLNVVGQSAAGSSPSWVALHPSNKKVLLATNELGDGKVLLFQVKEDTGLLELVQSVPTQGQNPAHLLVKENEVVAANYSSGSSLTIPLDVSRQPPRLGEPLKPAIIYEFPGVGPNPDRQEGSHPHQVYPHPNDEELLIPDLGSDKVWRLGKDADGVWDIKGVVPVAPGHGPRHVVVKDGTLFVLNELSNSLSAYALPALEDSTEAVHLATLPTLTPPAEAAPNMLAAAILLARYPEPLIYVSNRNDPHPEGDSIAIFAPTNGADVSLVAEVRTGLHHLRAVSFAGERDEYLIVGGLNGGGIKVFERVEGGKALKELAHLPEGIVSKPTSFAAL